MAKANIKTPDGTTILIEGSAEEVSLMVERIRGTNASSLPTPSKAKSAPKSARGATTAKSRKAGPKNRITELIDEGFFKKPKGLAEIKAELEVRAHFYAQNELSTPMVRLVKARALRRIKDGSLWKYAEA